MNEVSFSQKVSRAGKRACRRDLRALPIAMAKAGYESSYALARRAGIDPAAMRKYMDSGFPEFAASKLAAALGVSMNALKDAELLRLEEDKIKPADIPSMFPIPGLAACAARAGLPSHGWQALLAERIGVFRSKVSPWAAGAKVHSLTAARIAAALGCSIDDLRKTP